MKKLIIVLFIICSLFMAFSCTESGNEFDDPKYEKYEKPQTGFLRTGKELTPLQHCIKYIIDNGEFSFEQSLDGIGYRLELGDDLFAFYCVSTVYLAKTITSGRTAKTMYTKLNDDLDSFTICYKIVYARQSDFFAMVPCMKDTYNEEFRSEYEIYRGYIRFENDESKESLREDLFAFGHLALTKFNSEVGSKAKYPLSSFGYQNY